MRNVFLLATLIFSYYSFSQKSESELIDSLTLEVTKSKVDTNRVNLFYLLSKEYRNSDLKKSEIYAFSVQKLSNKLKWKKGIAHAYASIAGVNYKKGNFAEAKNYYTIAIKKYHDIKCKKEEANSITMMGNCYGQQDDITKALDCFHKSLAISEIINADEITAKNHSGIARINYVNNKYDEAVKEEQIAISLFTKNNLKVLLAYSYSNISNYYEAANDIDNAKKYNQKLLGLSSELGNKNLIGIAYSNLAGLSTTIVEQIEYCKKAIAIQEEVGDLIQKSVLLSNLGSYYEELANQNALQKNKYLNQSLAFYNQALKLQQQLGNKYYILDTYKFISGVEQKLGNYKQAIKSLELSSLYKDSIYNEDNKETIKNLEDKRTIEVKEKQLKINQLELQAKEKQKWFYIFGIGLFAVVGGLLFYQSRNRKKTNEKLQLLNTELDQANKTKTRFFSILNHDLRGPVANLIHFLHLQKDNPELLDEETKNRMQNKTISGAENLLSSMEDILLWSKGQMENFKPQAKIVAVNDLFEDTKKVFSGYHKIKFEYHNSDAISIFTDENYLKTIVRNLTSNAINVFTTTPNPTIIWKAWQENGVSYLSITDNGPGASKEQFKALYDDKEVVGIKSGLGLHLIRDLAKAINCEISVNSIVNEGTTFVLKI